MTLAASPEADPSLGESGASGSGWWGFVSVVLGGLVGAAATVGIFLWAVLPRFELGFDRAGHAGSTPELGAAALGAAGEGAAEGESPVPDGSPAGGLTERDRELLDSLVEQLEHFERRNWVGGLADRAIVTGSRDAYRALAAAAGDDAEFAELAEGIRAELFKVERFYTSGNRLGSYVIPVAELMAGRGFESESDLAAGDLVAVLLDHDSVPWMARGRAAWLLGKKGEAATVEDLVTAIRTEPHLDVLKECVYTFEELTGYRAERVFDTDALLGWWQENRTQTGAESAASPPEGDG